MSDLSIPADATGGTRGPVAGVPATGPEVDVVRPPFIPVATLLITTATAIVMLVQAWVSGAGDTDEISAAAALCWTFGSFLGLLLFAWFGSLDADRRASLSYAEPWWRPRLVAGVLAVTGWLVGCAGAFLVAEAVARR